VVKVYLDSCLLIYRVEGAEPFSQAVADAVRRAGDVIRHGCEQLWTNDRRFEAVGSRLDVRVAA